MTQPIRSLIPLCLLTLFLTGIGPEYLARVGLTTSVGVAHAEGQDEFMADLEKDFKDPAHPELQSWRAVKGSKHAPIMIFEYSDFQCPYCRKGFDTVQELEKKYGKKIGFVFKNFPLPFHPLALPAAKYFTAIAMQSAKKAYEFHDAIFSNQEEFTRTGTDYLDTTAKKIGVNMKRLKKDVDSQKVTDRIEADKAEANKFGFSGTPGFIVNGVRVKGAYPTDVFVNIIDRELAEKAPKAAKAKKAKKKAKAEASAEESKTGGSDASSTDASKATDTKAQNPPTPDDKAKADSSGGQATGQGAAGEGAAGQGADKSTPPATK